MDMYKAPKEAIKAFKEAFERALRGYSKPSGDPFFSEEEIAAELSANDREFAYYMNIGETPEGLASIRHDFD